MSHGAAHLWAKEKVRSRQQGRTFQGLRGRTAWLTPWLQTSNLLNGREQASLVLGHLAGGTLLWQL